MKKSDLGGSASNLTGGGNDSLMNDTLNLTAVGQQLNETADNNNTSMSQSGGGGGAAINLVPNFQCHLCPCKYKRSNDLTKHLRLKHQMLGTRSFNSFNAANGQQSQRTASQNGYGQEDEYDDMDEIDQMNDDNGEYADHLDQDEEIPHQAANSNNISRGSGLNNSQQQHVNATTTPAKIVTPSPAAAAAAAVTPAVTGKNGELMCPYCVYTTRASNEYLSHVRDHLSGKMFRCVLCNSVYKYRGDCVVHLKRKHQSADMIAHNYVDKFSLETMPVQAVYSLLKPKQTEEVECEQEKLFGCAYCDYKANYKGDVYKHQTRRHPGTPKMINSLAGGGASASLVGNGNHGSSRFSLGNNPQHQSNHHHHHHQMNNSAHTNQNATFNSNEFNEYEDECYLDEDEELDDERSGSGSGVGGGGSAGVDHPTTVKVVHPIPIRPNVAHHNAAADSINKDVISLDEDDDECGPDFDEDDDLEYGGGRGNRHMPPHNHQHHLHNNNEEYDDDVDEINGKYLLGSSESKFEQPQQYLIIFMG